MLENLSFVNFTVQVVLEVHAKAFTLIPHFRNDFA